jgi:hypothetical protein
VKLNVGLANASVAIPVGLPSATTITRVAGIDADTVFGVGQVGRVNVDLSINSLFCLVTTLEAKVQILSERAKNTGVLFHDVAYASEKEFALSYHPANSSGQGAAGFVDIISIWNFATIDHGDSESWLTEQKNAKSVGYTHALDAKYAYSMGVRYPSAFAGSDKEDITSTSTIKMLKSIVTWRGNGLGDGYKEKLTESMTQAIRSHKKYCDDFVPKGWLREHALWSGQYTQTSGKCYWHTSRRRSACCRHSICWRKIFAFSCQTKSYRSATIWQNSAPTPVTWPLTTWRRGRGMPG